MQMSDEQTGDSRGGLGRRAFLQRMAVAGFAVPAIVTLGDVTAANASCRPPHHPTTTAAPTTTPAPTTTAAPVLTTTGSPS
jgi:hypothetical protein